MWSHVSLLSELISETNLYQLVFVYERKLGQLFSCFFWSEIYNILIGYCINTTFYDRGHVSDALPSLVMRFRDKNEVIKCCIYTITLLLYTRIKLTGIMLINEYK